MSRYTINIRGEQDKKDPKMVKLKMIFFKSGYNRAPKVLDITGPIKDWDQKSQSFRTGSAAATSKNKRIFDVKNEYLHVANQWEIEGRAWSPIQWSHAFDEAERTNPEVKVKSVLQMIESIELYFREKKRFKNGVIVQSLGNAKHYAAIRKVLIQFTNERYGRSFSSYYFQDITEQFLLDFAFWTKEQGVRNGNKAGLAGKLRRLRAICNYAKKEGMYGVNLDAFQILGDDMKFNETKSRAASERAIAKIINVDRTLLNPREQLHIDLFLFSYFTGGMSNVDVCNLTWNMIQGDKIIYERIKYPKKAKPMLLKPGKEIIQRYKGAGYANYVFPIFTANHNTAIKRQNKVNDLSEEVARTLKKVCKLLRIREHITWYSARGSFISKMVTEYDAFLVAEMAGNSPQTIAKHYYKNTREQEVKKRMEDMFA